MRGLREKLKGGRLTCILTNYTFQYIRVFFNISYIRNSNSDDYE